MDAAPLGAGWNLIRRWTPVAIFVLIGALSLVLLEMNRRRTTEALRGTVVAVDNLAHARLRVTSAQIQVQQRLADPRNRDFAGALADLRLATQLLGDLRVGRSSLPALDRAGPVLDSQLIEPTEAYAVAIARLEELLSTAAPPSPIELDLAFAQAGDLADRLEREMYGSLADTLRVEERRHRLWLAGWAAFLLLIGTALSAARAQRGRADRAREEAEDLRAKSEARFRALVEGSDEIVVVLTTGGEIRYASPAVERVLGYAAAAARGRSAFGPIHRDDRGRARAALSRALENEARVAAELRVRDSRGEWRSLAMTATSMLEDPAVEGVVVNAQDVTELRRSEERVRQAQKMEAVGRLAGGIAHDFNNLLLVIKGNAQMALLDLDPENPVREDIEEVERAAERAARLTSQLLAFSRQQVLQPVVVDLNAVVTGVESMLRRTLGEDVDIVTSLEPRLGRVKADPGQIDQILLNLAVNARDAMPTGGTLTITTRNEELTESFVQQYHYPVRPGRYVLLSVSDTGVGIDDAVRDRIFEPFYTTKPAGQGTGLGLATVYGIVKQSGGHIWVDAGAGRGATFRVYLPQVDEEPASPSEVPARVERRGDATILLVEDDDAVRSTVRRALERMGHRVLTAADGAEALDIAGEHGADIDLLITDVVMPRMSGSQLAAELTRRWPDVAVLFASGYTDEAVLRHGVMEGETAFLQKPFDPTALSEKIRDLLATR